MAGRVDLDGKPIKPITICMIGAGGFIGSHLCEKLMSETEHKVLAVDVYNDKIKHLLEPASLPWAGRIQFHRLNIKNDSRLEGLIKMADLVILPSFCASLSIFFVFVRFEICRCVPKYFIYVFEVNCIWNLDCVVGSSKHSAAFWFIFAVAT